MSAVAGYNPLRWNCDDRGCYNVKHRPKIEFFAGALPGKIAMTDVDATTEVNGHFLFLEWKSGDPRDPATTLAPLARADQARRRLPAHQGAQPGGQLGRQQGHLVFILEQKQRDAPVAQLGQA